MTKNDMLAALDLGAKVRTKAAAEPLDVIPTEPAAAETAKSETALVVDDWGLRRGAELLAESEKLREHLVKVGDDARTVLAAADFHSAAFDWSPELNPACEDAVRHRFIKQLLETPEYAALHTATAGDAVASEIAAVHFAAGYSVLVEAETARAEKKKLKGPPGKNPTDAGSKEEEEFEREMETARCVGVACEKATEDVDAADEAAKALGAGAEGGPRDPKRIAELYRRLRESPQLRKIFEAAGRYRRIAQSKQRRKQSHGQDEITGVEPGGDPARLQPSELGLLGTDLEDDLLRRVVERQAQCREFKASVPVGKGPVIFVVDESGSMDGDHSVQAKAMALAMAWVARHQRRWCCLIAFSGCTGHRILTLPVGRWNEAALIEWLEAFLGGGSSRDVPIVELPDFYRQSGAPAGQTDVVMVTDAYLRITDKQVKDFVAWKAACQVKVTSLVVGSADPGDLRKVSENVHRIRSISAGEDAVGDVLGL